MMSFNLLTYNLHKGFTAGNRRFVLHDIRRAIQATTADIVLLQEVQGEHRRHSKQRADWPTQTQFEYLADDLWSHYAYARNAVYPNGHHGNAVLSRCPIDYWHNLNVSKRRYASRSLLHTRIMMEAEQPVDVICVHLGLTEGERNQQYAQLEHYIHTNINADAALIIAGDFNDAFQKAAICLEHQLGMREAHKEIYGEYARSFPARFPIMRVDRIYFQNLKLDYCHRLNGPLWRRLSDHIPLQAGFSLR